MAPFEAQGKEGKPALLEGTFRSVGRFIRHEYLRLLENGASADEAQSGVFCGGAGGAGAGDWGEYRDL